MLPTEEKRKQIEAKGRIREFVFGIQDGLISTVGLVAGLQAAGSNRFVILMAGTAAVLSGAFSMSAGAYLSSKSEKEIFDHELAKEAKFVEREPYLAQEGLLQALHEEGLTRETSYRIVKLLHQQKSVFVATFQEKVLGLGSADVNNPVKGALVMALSFVVGGVVPVLPFVFLPLGVALIVAALGACAALFAVGMFKGRLAGQPLGRSGLEFLVIAVIATGIGYGIGYALEKIAGVSLPAA
ncbi:MAG: VIT1/CCC1 transporter family protein [Bacteroidota bacterium]